MSEANFHQQLAELAQSWFALAQSSIRWRDRITPTQTLAHQPADVRGVLACAVELAKLLDSHPEARKALPDLAGQPKELPMPDSPQIAQADIDAAWQLVMAVAPQLATDPCLLMRDGNLSAVAMQALQTRLTLRLRLDAEVVPVRRDWVQAVTALSRSAQQLADAQQAVQVVGALAPVAHTPAQTVRPVLDGSAPDAGAGAARPAPSQQPAQPVQG